jgi:hypothetical protein
MALSFPILSLASDSVSATKTRNPDGTYSTTPGSFTITTAQEIRWIANYFGSGTEGNDFCLYQSPTNLNEFILSSSLSSGLNSGTYYLSPGTYNISVQYFGMGPGNYSIVFNRTASIEINPLSHDFGSLLEGETSSPYTFTIRSGGDADDYPVTITNVTSSDAVHFEVSDIPGGQAVPPNRTFKVRFKAGTAAGGHSAVITASGTSPVGAVTATASVTGETLPKIPDVACGQATTPNLGSADWYTGVPQTFSYSIKNTGSKELILTAIDIHNDPATSTAFAWASSPSLAPIPPSGSRPVSIRFAPPFDGGEANYYGHLEIQSNDPDEPVLICPFMARAHHPAPRIFLEWTEIDYREVEIDYYFHQALKVTNLGDAPLTFDIRVQDPADPDLGQFDLTTGSQGPIAGGLSALYEMTFHPTSSGNKEILLVVDNTNEMTPTSTTVTLKGSGTNPIPLSSVLVIDRSGSMDGLCGDVKKNEAARQAGILYTNLIRDMWDWLGVTKYNQNNSTPVPLAAISANRATAQAKINDLAGEFMPTGTTGIGGGMQRGAQEFASSPAGNALAMILLTDGKENERPWISEVRPGIMTDYPQLHIFCVGLGNPIETDPLAIEGVEISKLQEIAEDSDALFQSIQSFSGENRYALERFYFKAFAKATGRQTVLDPVYVFPASSSLQEIAAVNIVGCDRDADFLVISDLFKIEGMQLMIYLQDPTGQIIEAGAMVGGIGVHVQTWDNCKLIRVKFPARSQLASYAGTWKLFLKPIFAKPTTAALSYPTKNVMLAFMASVGSDYRLTASLTEGEVLVGQPIHITATTTEAWWPSPGAEVTAHVTLPDHSTVTETLSDDGAHSDGSMGDAVHGLDFVKTNQKGVYEFLIRSVGKTERGETVVREEALSKYVGPSEPDTPRPTACFPCWLLRLIIAVIVILLLIILYYLIVCCCRKRFAQRG